MSRYYAKIEFFLISFENLGLLAEDSNVLAGMIAVEPVGKQRYVKTQVLFISLG